MCQKPTQRADQEIPAPKPAFRIQLTAAMVRSCSASGDVMKRRKFISLLGCAAAWPLTLRAQQMGKTYRIGMLEALPAVRNAANLDALRKGLRELGYTEERNLVIEYRSADGRAERFPDLASQLVHLKVDLILARGTPAAIAAKNATGTIPVIMATMGGPGAIVPSFAHPGGNITGVITFSTELTANGLKSSKSWSRVSRELPCFTT
jgi:putative tryptophan/tyrosine transport system substrate-binding protein